MTVTELEVPGSLQPGEALLAVEGNGLCGTDYEAYDGSMARMGMLRYPVIPGHETVGRIVAVGPPADLGPTLRTGDRVAVEAIIRCGRCPGCRDGAFAHCAIEHRYSQTPTSVSSGLWGGLADYMVLVPGTRTHAVPEALTVEDAVLFNPVASGIEWVVRTAATGVGDSVLIIGAGQRGLTSVVAAIEAGAERVIVAGLQKDAANLALATRFGATATVIVDEDDVVERTRSLTGGRGADRVLDLTPYATEPVVKAIDAAAPGGTVVIAGLKGMAEVPGFRSDVLIKKSLTLRGAHGSSSWAMARAIAIIASHRYPLELLHSHTIGLEAAEQAIRILGGEVPGERGLHITVVPTP